ncbi:hypothetical protein B0T09DRAFT_348384 [Sordaria sp. MPI-SDFR-AT-0083]|nr:hypothetical protein B0T09DRAFT_348384 [Sordaria sp. MPI-SDFR-AT-0083]
MIFSFPVITWVLCKFLPLPTFTLCLHSLLLHFPFSIRSYPSTPHSKFFDAGLNAPANLGVISALSCLELECRDEGRSYRWQTTWCVNSSVKRKVRRV